jgi:hypothetical protein
MDFDKADVVRRKIGLDGVDVRVPADFGDPAFGRQVLGLPE